MTSPPFIRFSLYALCLCYKAQNMVASMFSGRHLPTNTNSCLMAISPAQQQLCGVASLKWVTIDVESRFYNIIAHPSLWNKSKLQYLIVSVSLALKLQLQMTLHSRIHSLNLTGYLWMRTPGQPCELRVRLGNWMEWKDRELGKYQPACKPVVYKTEIHKAIYYMHTKA